MENYHNPGALLKCCVYMNGQFSRVYIPDLKLAQLKTAQKSHYKQVFVVNRDNSPRIDYFWSLPKLDSW